jgi:adenylosuccinate synthase
MERKIPTPVYKSFAGWNTASSAANSYEVLPETMKVYVNFINQYLGVSIHYISNGPGRDQIILVK